MGHRLSARWDYLAAKLESNRQVEEREIVL